MHARTKKTNIPRSVKERVYERDKGKCLICGRTVYVDNACCHYISRARLGMGIEENVISLCHDCHRRFDGADRKLFEDLIREYLISKYPGWDERKLVYSKWSWIEGDKDGAR